MVQTHKKVHFLEAISLHYVWQVVMKNIHGGNTQKSALLGSQIPTPCVASSSKEDPFCQHTIECTFWKPYPCTICDNNVWRRSMLQTHGKVHDCTFWKPYPYTICGNIFWRGTHRNSFLWSDLHPFMSYTPIYAGYMHFYFYFPCVCTMDPLKNYLSHMVKNMASRKCPFGVFAPLILFRTTCQWPCSVSGCFLLPWMHPCYS